jgi:hypothetical protein
MNDNLKTLFGKSNCQDQESSKTRRLYSKPVLVVYGSVGELTRGGEGSGADGGTMAGMTRVSDRALKENIAWVGDHSLGFCLYLFDYKSEFRDTCGHGRQFGVMADEVQRVMPEAVSVHANGYKQVDYALLGITSKRSS